MSEQNLQECVNRIFRCEVTSVHSSGAFMRVPSCGVRGIVYCADISSKYVADARDMLNEGDRAWCKVVSVSADGWLNLSMRVVDQLDGSDLQLDKASTQDVTSTTGRHSEQSEVESFPEKLEIKRKKKTKKSKRKRRRSRSWSSSSSSTSYSSSEGECKPEHLELRRKKRMKKSKKRRRRSRSWSSSSSSTSYSSSEETTGTIRKRRRTRNSTDRKSYL